MSIGTNIKRLREEKKLTQEKLAEAVGVTFQAISAWERDEYVPDTKNLIELRKALDTSYDSIMDEPKKYFKTKQAIYDWEHMKTFVKTTARTLKLPEALRAVDFAVEKHEGQKRKKSDIPYIYHPLNMACHAISMGILDDEVIAACLLHDVVEDCGVRLEDLPFKEEVREIVRLLTHVKTNEEDRDEVMETYYEEMLSNPKAALVKCIDRCNNLTTMSWALSRDRIFRMIRETEKYYPQLLQALKSTTEYGNASWLLKYQIESMLDIYKRLM